MADKFWVGGSGNWSDATNHWATSSGGAPGAGNLPTASDNAIFDTLSNAVGYTVTINSAAVCSQFNVGDPLTGAVSFVNDANTTRTLTLSGNSTISAATLTITGNSASNRLHIKSNTVGTPRTITAAAVSLTDIDFTDITGAGAASPFTGTRIGDAKGNSGITFTAAANKYYVGNTANWNTANVWALTSGGAGATNNFPLPQDTAVLDAGSFSANGQTLTLSAAHRIGTLTCSGTDQTYTLAKGAAPTFYGDITLDANCTISGASGTTFAGRTTQTITSAGKVWTGNITITSPGGTVTLGDNYETGSTNSGLLNSGTLDLNGKTFSVAYFDAVGTVAKTLKSSINGGVLKTLWASAGGVLSINAASTTIDRASGTWTIEIAGNTTAIRTIDLNAGKTWPAISFTNTTAGGELDIVSSGAATVIKSLTVTNPAQTIKRTAGTTITIEDNNGFPSGTAGNLVTIGSITAASHTWAKSGGGRIESDYLSISRSTATPATTWYAGANSTDGGNNSGWTFAPYTPSIYVNGFMAWF